MKQLQLSNFFLNQSKNPIWMIDLDFQLIYANKAYLDSTKKVTGEQRQLNESIFEESDNEVDIKKWKAYYSKALNGEHFEVEEHSYHQDSDQLQYTQVTFEPLTGEDDKIFAVACQSKDITRVVKEKSEENQLIDSSLDVFCTVNEQGNFVYVSAASLNHWGYLPEELIGKSYKDLILEEDTHKTNEIVESLLNGTGINSFVNRYKKKDGSIAYNMWSARWDDRAKLRYAVARDGKEKIKQEEALLLSEQRLKALVTEGSELIRILDAEGNIIYASPSSTSILGIAPEDFIGKNIFDYIHPDDVANALKCLQKINTDKKISVPHVRFQNHKKEWRFMESVLTNMLDHPAVNGIVVNSRDITAQIEKEHQLKLFESVITNTRDAVLITEAEPFDQPGPRIIYVNEAFTKMTGYSAEEVIGKTPRILQGPNSNSEELSRLSAAIRNWECCEITTINYKKNGEEFWVNFTVTPVANEEGWYTHWIAMERDVTEQKTKELEKEIIAKINLNFNSKNDLNLASNKLCKSIGDFGKFDWVELWTTNLEKSQMQLFSHYVAAPEDETFYEDTQEFIAYPKSEGLQGIAWAKGKQLLLENVGESKDFIRRNAAKKIGLKSVIGIPLFSNNEVIGILNVGSKHDASYLRNYTRIFKELEGVVGSELNRKKLENDLSHLFNVIPDIICVMDFQGKFLKINKTGCDLLGYCEEEILYHNFQEFAHPDDKGIFINEVDGLEKEQNKFKFENRYITKSGDIVWLSWYCNSFLKEGLIYATAKDITSIKIAEEAKNSIQVTLDNSLNEIYIFEAETLQFSYANKGALRNIGYSETEIKALTPFDIEPDYTASSFNQLIAPLVTNEKEKVVLFTNFKRKNGSIYPVEVHLQLVKEGSNKRFLAIVLDITDWKRAQENLGDSEEKNRLIMNSALDAIICMDVEGDVTLWNSSAEKIFGWLSNEVIGQKLSNYIIPENFRSMHDHGMNHYLKTGEAKVFNQLIEISALHKNGETFPVELTIIPIKQGKEEFFCSFIRDITNRKKAEESILQSNERFEKVTEATKDGIWDWDLEKKTYFRSKAVEIFFGQEASGLFSDSEIWTRKSMHPEDYDKVKQSFYKAFANPLSPRWESEYRIINKLGETLNVIDRALILRNSEGEVTRVVGAITDISEVTRMTQELRDLNQSLEQRAIELERSNEELEQFAFVASHDLQEPLRMVTSFMDLLKLKYESKLDEKGQQYIHFATDAAKRMKRLMLDLLDYSRATKHIEGEQEVNLNDVLSEFKQLRQQLISEKSAEITSNNLPTLNTYRAAITQILHCLLDNALKYSVQDAPPRIKVHAVEKTSEWSFSIKDNGIGIEPQFHDKIFVIFQRLHNNEKYTGTGIGLSITKRQVEFLGGKIWLESVPGEGTVFYFSIPKTK
ncbi:MAG: PAS domain S-box-containing protein [Roseivirga sp.]|jgi:PAS domain S-box-containing protein